MVGYIGQEGAAGVGSIALRIADNLAVGRRNPHSLSSVG